MRRRARTVTCPHPPRCRRTICRRAFNLCGPEAAGLLQRVLDVFLQIAVVGDDISQLDVQQRCQVRVGSPTLDNTRQLSAEKHRAEAAESKLREMEAELAKLREPKTP